MRNIEPIPNMILTLCSWLLHQCHQDIAPPLLPPPLVAHRHHLQPLLGCTAQNVRYHCNFTRWWVYGNLVMWWSSQSKVHCYHEKNMSLSVAWYLSIVLYHNQIYWFYLPYIYWCSIHLVCLSMRGNPFPRVWILFQHKSLVILLHNNTLFHMSTMLTASQTSFV